jgi:hypothetical protein
LPTAKAVEAKAITAETATVDGRILNGCSEENGCYVVELILCLMARYREADAEGREKVICTQLYRWEPSMATTIVGV